MGVCVPGGGGGWGRVKYFDITLHFIHFPVVVFSYWVNMNSNALADIM